MDGNVGRMVSFNGTNWVTWKTKMEDLLFCKDLNGPIEGDSGKPKEMKDDEWKKLDQKAVVLFGNGLMIVSFIMSLLKIQHMVFGPN